MSAFNPGDAVKVKNSHKSSPIMTVNASRAAGVECVWFVNRMLQVAVLSPDALVAAPVETKDAE